MFLPPSIYPLIQKLGCIFIHLSKDLQIKEFNFEAERIYGCTEASVLDKNFIQLCNDVNIAPPIDDFCTVLSGRYVDQVTQVFFLHSFVKKVQWTIAPIFDRKNPANITSILLIGVDENLFLDFDQLTKKIKNFEFIINSVPHAIFWKDKDSVFLGCNEKFAHLAMLNSTEEIVGKTDYDLPWSKKESDQYVADDHFVIQSKKEKLNIEENLTNQNEPSFLLTSKVPLYDNRSGEVSGVLGIFTDITNLKKTEEELKVAKIKAEVASKAKSEFIANMSHDIRTPITGMVGMIQDLLNTMDETELALKDNVTFSRENLLKLIQYLMKHVKNDSEILMSSVDQLLQLCNEILELTRLENGILDQRPESFDIHQLIQHNIDFLQPVAKNKKLVLSAKIGDNVPKYVKGLRSYVNRTIVNLVSNALKFTKKGYVKINLSLREERSAQHHVGDRINLQISIKDTGIGIPEDKFETIFEHFSRLTSSYQGIYEGSGLGLYTVKRYVEAMEGEIEVESKIGEGTCFKIILPLVISDRVDKLRQSIRTPAVASVTSKPTEINLTSFSKLDKSELGSGHILMVEDSKVAAIGLTLTLKPFNCIIDFAETGAGAIKKAQNNTYDLILMDVGLPDMTGIDVTKAIRAFSDVQKSSVPIIGVTGHANDPEMRHECLDAGMQEVLSKPTQVPLLKPIFERFVFNKKAQ